MRKLYQIINAYVAEMLEVEPQVKASGQWSGLVPPSTIRKYHKMAAHHNVPHQGKAECARRIR